MKTEKHGRDSFNKYKKLLNLLVKITKCLPQKLRIWLFVRFRRMEGVVGIGIRYVLLKSVASYCGDNVGIDTNVYILNPQNISIGNNVSINPMCYFECGKNPEFGIKIGNDVSIAHGVTIMAATHSYSDISLPIKNQPIELRPVRIENNCWIGAKATILAGVSLASGCIVGAGAVVTKNIEVNQIVVGVPAKLLKERK